MGAERESAVKAPSPKADAQRAMKLAKYEAQRRGPSRERAVVQTSVDGALCGYEQPRTGLTCLKVAHHHGHHRFVPEAAQIAVPEADRPHE